MFKSILYLVLGLFGLLVLFIILSYIFMFFIHSIIVLKKYKKNIKKYPNIFQFKKSKRKFLKICFLMHRYPKHLDFLKWVITDILRGKDSFKLFGIWCFTGYFGQGKTLGAVTYAKRIQKERLKVGEYWNIAGNFYIKDVDIRIKSWEDLLNLPHRTIIIFDEIQSTFTSNKYNAFPVELLWKLTQCRKHQLVLFASTPVYRRMSIQLRENSDYVIDCKNFMNLDRWFNYKFYNADEYEANFENPDIKKKKKLYSVNFVINDWDYKNYNTNEKVDRYDIEEDNKKVKPLTYKKLKDDVIRECESMIRKRLAG